MAVERKHQLEPTPFANGWDWTRIGVSLVVVTLGYNVAEAAIALWFGTEAESVALIGFGLDSVIETAAASVLLWRLLLEARGAPAEVVERTEHRVHQFVGITFLILDRVNIIEGVTAQSVWTLMESRASSRNLGGGDHPDRAVSLVLMPLVSWGKLRASRMKSKAPPYAPKPKRHSPAPTSRSLCWLASEQMQRSAGGGQIRRPHY